MENKNLDIIVSNYPLFKNGTSKRDIRHNFFSKIQTEIQAYLLGFIMSDGSINKKRNTLTIHINDKDSEIFDLFKIISPEAYIENCRGYESIATIEGRTIKNKSSIRLNISSKILIEDLEKLGVVENKTYNELHIPEIPKSLIRHFFRGYFDEDGCFTYSIRKPNIANREKNWRVCANINIVSKTATLMTEFQRWLSNDDIKVNINFNKNKQYYVLQSSSRNTIEKVYHLMYDNSNFYLSRKFSKFNYYVNIEVNQIIADYRNAQEVNANESNNPPKSAEHPIEDENVR